MSSASSGFICPQCLKNASALPIATRKKDLSGSPSAACTRTRQVRGGSARHPRLSGLHVRHVRGLASRGRHLDSAAPRGTPSTELKDLFFCGAYTALKATKERTEP